MVRCMNITIRGVDERVFREFKAEAVRDGTAIGKAVTRAMKTWLNIKEKEGRPGKSLLDLTPFDWGDGTENSSMEVDQILYGE